MIFISYCRLDLDLVRRLVRALKDQGREVWIDEEGIPPAGPIKAEICSAIEQAERFIFVLSPDSVASAYCRTELQHAVENKKSLIPVVCRHVPNADVPQALTDLDWISFREADAFELALEELRSALDTDIEQIRQHTRLENRAREWDRERRPASLLLRGEDLDGVEKLLPSIAKSIPSAYRELEHEYVASSRKEQSRRQRLVVRSLAAALGVAVLLTVTAVWFWVLARLNASKVKTELVHQLVANGFRDQENASPSASLPWFAKSQEYSEDEVAAEMARARMATVLRQSPTLANLWRPSNSETLLDAGAGGLRALTMTKNRTLRVWDTTKGSSSAGTPLRHDGWFCAKLIADGRRVVSEAPHSLIVWDAEDGRLVARIEKQMPERSTSQGQAENARRVIVLPEPARPESTYEAGSRFVMTFHRDGAKVWDAEDGRLIGERLTVPAPHGAHLILSRDGRRVLAHHDGTVTVIDVRTGKPFPPLQGIDAEVMGVDISGDARLVTTVCEVVPVDTGRSTSTPRDLQIKFDHGLTFGPDLTGQFVFRTWEVETGRPLSPPIRIMIDPGNDRIESSPDGRRLLVADRLSTFRLWDVFSGQPVSPVITHDWLRQPGLSLVDDTGEAPSSTVGTGSSGPFANQTPNELAFNPAPSGRHAEFSPDGRRMVLVDDHGVTWVCDSATGKPVLPPVQTGDWWTVARFSPDGRSVYTVRSDGLIQTWDISRQDLSPRRLVDSNDEGFLYCKFIQDGRRLMVFGRDKGVCWIRFHDVETGHPVGRIALGDVHTGSPTFSRDGRLMAAVGMGEGRVYVWDVTTGKPIASEAVMSGGSFFEIPFTPDGREILTLSDSNQALLWELPARRGAAPKVLPIDISAVDRVEFSRDGRLLIARSLLNERAWDVRTWRLLPGCAAHNSEFSRHTKLSPDGTRVFRSEGGRGRVYDTRTAQPLTPILPVGSPSFVAFSPDGRRVVTINEDAKNRSTARTWDATTGRALSQPIRFDQIHRFAPVGAPAQFSPDGRGLLLLSNDGASLWDAETGTACWSYFVDTRQPGVSAVQFSADGRRILAQSGYVARVRDAATGLPISPLLSSIKPAGFHSGECVSFGPDGRYAVTLDRDGLPTLFDLSAGRFPADRLSILSRLYAGREVSENGGSMLIDSAGMEALWRSLVPGTLQRPGAGDSLAWHRRQAAESEAARHWVGAAFHLNRLVAADPDDPDLLFRHGMALAWVGWDAEAVRAFVAYAKRRPGLPPEVATKPWSADADWYVIRGAVFARAGRVAEAIREFKAARHLPDGFSVAIKGVYEALGDSDDAYGQRCHELLDRFGAVEDPTLVEELVFISALSEPRKADACRLVAVARRALDQDPTNQEVKAMLGLALYRAGSFEEALQCLDEARRCDRRLADNPCLTTFLAMAYQRLGQAGPARTHLERARASLNSGSSERPVEDLRTDSPRDVEVGLRHLLAEAQTLVGIDRPAASGQPGSGPSTPAPVAGTTRTTEGPNLRRTR